MPPKSPPSNPPDGMKRYKATLRSNPFQTPWPTTSTQVVDVDANMPFEQVKGFAIAAAKSMGLYFSSLEVVE